MKKIIPFALLIVAFTACKKKNTTPVSTPLPEMTYRSYNITAGYQQSAAIDIDNNGTKDISFGYQLVGDPIAQEDKHQFFVNGGLYNYFPVNSMEGIPVLQKGDAIGTNNFSGFNWYNASWILLAERVVSFTQPDLWRGPWKNASHQYFPFYLIRDDKKYYGWFEISFDTATQKIMLHASGIAKEANVAVKAGY